ncbi:MAG: DUF3303 family protein [Actinobacteria bacterium]|nr:DUF3303 family protein [Actinomycetota bacterium]
MHGPEPVYARSAERGRMLPDGVRYVDSWVTADLRQCFQLTETDDRALLDDWMAEWDDLVRFEVVLAIDSVEAAARMG